MLKKDNIKDIYSLTPLQEGMLFYYLKDEDSTAYFEQTVITIKGEINLELLEKSCNKIIEKYDVLRTVFSFKKTKRPMQVLLKKQELRVVYVDISHLDEKEKPTAFEQYKTQDRENKFDLTRDLLFRVLLVKTGEDSYKMLLSHHHIIMDGWCLGIIYKDLIRAYKALQAGIDSTPEQTVPYSRYITWLEKYDKKDGLNYWKNYLDGYDQSPPLQQTRYNNESNTYKKDEYNFNIDESLSGQLKKIAEENQVTVNALFQAAWGILWQKCNNNDDVVFGAVVSGRNVEIEGIDHMVGLFINTIPIRITTREKENYRQLIKKTHQQAIYSHRYEFLPLFEIQKFSRLKGDLIDHIMVFQNVPVQQLIKEATTIPELGFSVQNMKDEGHTSYDLDITVTYTKNIFYLRYRYNLSAFKRDFIERLAFFFNFLVQQVIENPGLEIKDLEIIPTPEKKQVLYEFNSTRKEYPKNQTIIGLFEKQVTGTPDHTAVIGPGPAGKHPGHLTYCELNQKVNQLAILLREKGLQPGSIAAIMAERSLEMIIGIWGILKAGGAYLPLDPGYPGQRIQYMLIEANIKILIKKSNTISDSPAADLSRWQGETIFLESGYCQGRGEVPSPVTEQAALIKVREDPLIINKPPATAFNLAYVIYTSGSTGPPKGVMIEHPSLINRLQWMQNKYPLDQTDTILQKTTVTFDVSVWELTWWAITGARLCLLTPGSEKDPDLIANTIEKNRVTIIHFVPSMLNAFLEYLSIPGNIKKVSALKQVFSSGEELSPAQVKTFNELLYTHHLAKLANLYGPTEATVDVSYFDCPMGKGDTPALIPIGKPIDNTALYILDRHRNPLPVGLTGELYIAGRGLARGYLNRPGLTAEKFDHDLWDYQDYHDEKINQKFLRGVQGGSFFKKRPPGRRRQKTYKTGDLARWLPDGNIQFVGRIDQQVKIRGFRVELGEIENCLGQHPGIKESVVLAREDKNKDKFLCAYIVPLKKITSLELREFLIKYLPHYMIPAYFITMGTLPLTGSGKIDRKSLPGPDDRLYTGEKYVKPYDKTQEKLAEIWKNVLTTAAFGIKDNFFNIGGDSIKAIRLLNFINETFSTNLKIVDLFRNETIEKISTRINKMLQEDHLEKQTAAAYLEIERLKHSILSGNHWRETGMGINNIEDVFPMSDIETGMVFYSLKDTRNALYHDQFIFQQTYNVFETGTFKKALELVTGKHGILRTSFNIEDFEEPVHIIHKHVPVHLTFTDISHLDRPGQETYLKDIVEKDRLNSFNISKPPLWRMMIFLLDKNRNNICVIWVFHHAILDGWSNASLLTEIHNTYLKLKKQKDYVPLPLKSTYKDFVVHQMVEKKKDKNRDYWKSMLQDYKRLDFSGLSAGGDDNLKSFVVFKSRDYVEKLTAAAKIYNTGIQDLCFAAYVYVMSRLSFDNDVVVGLITNNRPLIKDGDKILGCFLNTVPFRLEVPGNINWKDYVYLISHKIKEIKEYERIPFFEILRIIEEKPQVNNPLFDTIFSFIDFHIYGEAESDDIIDGSSGEKVNMLSLEDGYENTNTLLDFIISTTFGQFKIRVAYSNLLVSDDNAVKLTRYFEIILDTIINSPDSCGTQEPFMPHEERQWLLYQLNQTAPDFSIVRTIHELFAEQVERTPNQIALVGKGEREKDRRAAGKNEKTFAEMHLTYQELNEKSHRLACGLQEKGVLPDTIVVIMMEHCPAMLIGLLGILKAGGAYLPIEPDSPTTRLNYMLTDSGARILLKKSEIPNHKLRTNPDDPDLNDQNKRAEVTVLDFEHLKLEFGSSFEFCASNLNPANLAYVIYTSGSTGKPKGVMVEHRALVNYIQWAQKVYVKEEKCDFPLYSPLSFDLTVTSIFVPLTSGNKIMVYGRDDNEFVITKILEDNSSQVIKLTPTHLQIIGSTNDGADMSQVTVKRWIVGGEALTTSLAAKIYEKFNKNIEIYNEYGPTETVVGCMIYKFNPAKDKGQSVPIGVPADNVRVYILNRNREPVPVGVIGEIYISGAGLARGYMNRPGLTAASFVLHPSIQDKRMYKTGDLARRLPDSRENIEFIGRIDQQLKIRGFRIEPGEIEAQLMQHRDIKEAVVISLSPGNKDTGNTSLNAYIVSDREWQVPELRGLLSEQLPHYMIPNQFIKVDRIPLTPNGKIDRKSLLSLGKSLDTGTAYAPPANDLERQVAEIWQEVLHHDRIGRNDNIFDIGGNSIDMIKIINKLNKYLDVNIPIVKMFQYPSIGSLANYLNQARAAQSPSIDKETRDKQKLNRMMDALENTVKAFDEIH